MSKIIIKCCPSCFSTNEYHYDWCKGKCNCGTTNSMHNTWCTLHLTPVNNNA